MHKQLNPENDRGISQKAAVIMRSLSILYNNSRVYGVEHAVFKKMLAEHMLFLQDAIGNADELIFTFMKGKVRCGAILLDPGSTVFQALAHTLEGMGISGFSIRHDVNSDEISKFVSLLNSEAEQISKNGLQCLLDKKGVRHIREQKVSLRTGESPETAKRTWPRPAKSVPRAAGKTFELDDGVLDLDAAFGAQPAGPKADGKTRPFKEFVTNSLMSLSGNKADVYTVADSISNEFNDRLEKETAGLRSEKEAAVRRLENVKSVLFEKLEALKVMAILVDTRLKILAMTSPTRDLLGDVNELAPETALARCVREQTASMDIKLKGNSLTAQTIASDSTNTGETILLLTLNPD